MEIKLKLKRNSLFLIYFFSIGLALFLFTPTHLSTNMLAIFKHDENIEKLKTMNSFEQASTLFVTIKGFSKEHRNVLLRLEKELQGLAYVKKTKFNVNKIEISDYMKKYYYLLSDFNPMVIEKGEVQKRIEHLKSSLLDSMFYSPIDKNDPFKLFTFQLGNTEKMTKNGYLTLGEHGYLLTAELDSTVSNMKRAREIESELSKLCAKYPNVIAFSILFFTAQNSTVIESNVHTILYLSFGLLILLFFITLRDYKLLLLNSITLASSILFALGLSTYIFEEVSIFTLAFGSAISSISVDYLFHNYFHGQYKKRGINYSIMWAFLTTLLGFFMLQFVAFPLISQLSIFAMFSLAFSYFQFTFLYPYFGLMPKKKRLKLNALNNLKKFLPSNLVFGLSLLTIIYAGLNVEFDYNLQNLDYDNKPLKEKQALIQNAMPHKHTLLIEAENFNLLIERAMKLHQSIPSAHSVADFALTQALFQRKREKIESYDFQKLKLLLTESAKDIGFKANYFEQAYVFVEKIPSIYEPKVEAFKSLGYEVLEKDNKFYSIATIEKKDLELLKEIEGVSLIDTAKLIKSTMSSMFKSLLLYLLLSFISIVVIIAFIVKRKTILALNFILFPIAMILLYLSLIQINIMHLFSIIIIIVAGIDYGIYVSQEQSVATNEAIYYSLFTSFSGFGILVLSSIGAIHSIGEVITVGIVSILFLVLFLKKN